MKYLLQAVPLWIWILNGAYLLYVLKWALVEAQKDSIPLLFRIGCVLTSPGLFCFFLLGKVEANRGFSEYKEIVMDVFSVVVVLMVVFMAIGGYQRVTHPNFYAPRRRALYRFLRAGAIFMMGLFITTLILVMAVRIFS